MVSFIFEQNSSTGFFISLISWFCRWVRWRRARGDRCVFGHWDCWPCRPLQPKSKPIWATTMQIVMNAMMLTKAMAIFIHVFFLTQLTHLSECSFYSKLLWMPHCLYVRVCMAICVSVCCPNKHPQTEGNLWPLLFMIKMHTSCCSSNLFLLFPGIFL